MTTALAECLWTPHATSVSPASILGGDSNASSSREPAQRFDRQTSFYAAMRAFSASGYGRRSSVSQAWQVVAGLGASFVMLVLPSTRSAEAPPLGLTEVGEPEEDVPSVVRFAQIPVREKVGPAAVGW